MKKLFIFLTILLMVSGAKTTVYPSEKKAVTGYLPPDKLCALTFDDGPSADPALTSRVLDKLESYGVVATFFLVGQNITDSTMEVISRMVAGGHEIGNHSWSYDDMAKMDADEVRKSVDDTTMVIRKYAGVSPVFFRPPNLSTSSIMFSTINMPFASGVVGGDWPGGGGDTTAHIMEKLMPGIKDGVIILLHDVQPKPHPTPEALDTLILKLKKDGYDFVTLSELFKRKGVVPQIKPGIMYVYVGQD